MQVILPVGKAAVLASMAHTLNPPAAQLGLVDSIRRAKLIVAVRKLAVAIGAARAQVRTELRLREVWLLPELVAGVRERARTSSQAPPAEEEVAELRLAELRADLRQDGALPRRVVLGVESRSTAWLHGLPAALLQQVRSLEVGRLGWAVSDWRVGGAWAPVARPSRPLSPVSALWKVRVLRGDQSVAARSLAGIGRETPDAVAPTD